MGGSGCAESLRMLPGLPARAFGGVCLSLAAAPPLPTDKGVPEDFGAAFGGNGGVGTRAAAVEPPTRSPCPDEGGVMPAAAPRDETRSWHALFGDALRDPLRELPGVPPPAIASAATRGEASWLAKWLPVVSDCYTNRCNDCYLDRYLDCSTGK